jgi:hypothetical protein
VTKARMIHLMKLVMSTIAFTGAEIWIPATKYEGKEWDCALWAPLGPDIYKDARRQNITNPDSLELFEEAEHMYAAVVHLWNQKQVEISNTDNGLVLTRSEQPRDQNTGEEVGPPYLREKKTREGTGQGEEKRQHAMEQQYVTRWSRNTLKGGTPSAELDIQPHTTWASGATESKVAP